MANKMMNTQKVVRGNGVQAGGVYNPSTVETGSPNSKMPLLSETSYFEVFRNATEFNSIAQAPVNINEGQPAAHNVHNIGFLQSIFEKVNISFTLTNSSSSATTDINFAEDAPFSAISRITSQFNGSTVTHSVSPYNLYALYAKRLGGLKGGIFAHSANDGHATTSTTVTAANVPTVNALINEGCTPFAKIYFTQLSTGAVVVTTSGAQQGITRLEKLTLPASGTAVVNFEFIIPVSYTPRKDMLLGLIPLQNNSVFLDVKFEVNTLLSTSYITPMIQSASGTTATSDYKGTITPITDFYSVPSPWAGTSSIYEYLINYNYIVSDSTFVENSTDITYNIPNNSYMLSFVNTFRDNSTKQLKKIGDILSELYINYNGTATVQKVPASYDLFKMNIDAIGGYSTPTGVYIKDFYNSLYTENGGDWSRALNLYDANSPTLTGKLIDGAMSNGTNITVTMEKIIPVRVMA